MSGLATPPPFSNSASTGGATSYIAPPHRRPRSPPALLPELVEEILLRVPPDEPAHLFRAALVCKPWRRILSDRGFLYRYRTFHRKLPLLGYLHNLYANGKGPIPPFVPTSAATPLSAPVLDCGMWWALDCRHGRVLIHTFNPQYLIAHSYYAGAVLCATDDYDHLDCHCGPFLVLFVGTNEEADDGPLAWVSMYSSKTGVWSAPIDIDVDYYIESKPSLLIKDALYFTLEHGISILKYDLGKQVLTEIEPPRVFGSIAMEVEDGALGFVCVGELDNCIYKWLWQPTASGTGRWAQHMVMELETLLPRPAPTHII
ncbi:unnamed protein product [Urochloa decumbens]|uniref:F-box domain-containing protein n=1 Tax=Urochloa decumbens TaxID=240449 RepID=A0ABC9FKG0_9POAL